MIFNVLKEKGVKATSYQGGLLTGKDIKKIMNNTTYLFNKFAGIKKRKDGRLIVNLRTKTLTHCVQHLKLSSCYGM